MPTIADSTSLQRIPRLTPLSGVLALIETSLGPVLPYRCPLRAALGGTLAIDVVASKRPPCAIALRDGFATQAAMIADADAYNPVPLAAAPQRVDAGEALPSGADAVAPLDAITLHDNHAEAIAAVSPGEGVLPPGGDTLPDAPLFRAGRRLRAIDLALMTAAGIVDVTVRAPRVRIACGSAGKGPPIEAAINALVHSIIVAGGTVPNVDGGPARLDEALADEGADAVIAVGGTGSGRRDGSVRSLASLGRVAAHGVAVSPGESAAFGFVGRRPVLLMPGRLDATMTIWLLIGRHILARLAGGTDEDVTLTRTLKRKVTSTIGVDELVPVSCTGDTAEPLASGYLSLASLARSDGWIVIPAESEGFGVGSPVAVQPWP